MNDLEKYIMFYQNLELRKLGIDSNFVEPHVIMAKIRRERSKKAIRIFWQNSLLLDIQKKVDALHLKEEWEFYDKFGKLLIKYENSN